MCVVVVYTPQLGNHYDLLYFICDSESLGVCVGGRGCAWCVWLSASVWLRFFTFSYILYFVTTLLFCCLCCLDMTRTPIMGLVL